MQMRSVEIIVGAFILAGVLALGALAIQVSGFNPGDDADTYSVYARFENIGGLAVRGKVSVAGVTVGQIAEISLDQETFTALVRIEINESVNQLSRDTTAAILTEGLLGGKYIGLIVGADEELLEEGDEILDTQSAIVLEELIGQFLLKAL